MAATETTSNLNDQRPRIPAGRTRVLLSLAATLLGLANAAAGGSSPFGLSIHHRFSDPVRAIFPASDHEYVLPEKGSVDYFAAMAGRDRIHGGRRLAAAAGNSTYKTPLTFIAGNTTYRYDSLGYLYFANVSIGTPGLEFLVALDTGSDILWIPCDCISCVKGLQTTSGEIIFNTYELNTSSTGKEVPCSSALCEDATACSVPNQCPYQREYLSANTSSSGYLVQDILHLATDSNTSKPVNATVTFGCGRKQTGTFLTGGAPNGLFGLGMEAISIPSTLARENVTENSFSMCFAPGGLGRISFGDKGSSDQHETPFTTQQHLTYFVSITEATIGKRTSDVEVAAVFDTGTSFTYFTDPTYTTITSSFNSQVKETRITETGLPFEFCYIMSSCDDTPNTPSIDFKMGGGAYYGATDPLFVIAASDQTCVYCLAVIKEESISIIGENFMTGYRVVFDRERMVLGWKESDCNYTTNSTDFPNYGSTPSVNTSGAPSTTLGHQLPHFGHWAFALFLLAAQLSAVL